MNRFIIIKLYLSFFVFKKLFLKIVIHKLLLQILHCMYLEKAWKHLKNNILHWN